MTDELGWPLDHMPRPDDSVSVTETRAPRRPCVEGTLRVVRVRDGAYVVARFPDRVTRKDDERASR